MIHVNMTRYPSGRKKEFNAWKSKKSSIPEFKPFQVKPVYRRETPQYASVDCSVMDTTKSNRNVYTGQLIKGISTMHKSNMVPIINDKEAKDHASMRR